MGATQQQTSRKVGADPLSHAVGLSGTVAKQHRIVFALLTLVPVVTAWRPLGQTAALAVQNDEYTQILLVFPILLTLIFLEFRSLEAKGDWNLRLGLPLLAIAFFIALFAHSGLPASGGDVRLACQMLALAVALIGVFFLRFGVEAWRSAGFPLLLLFALVPLPQRALDPIIGLMQEGSAWFARVLFTMSGIPAIQKGVLVTIPGLTIHVAQECSSIRSSSMLLITTILLTQFFLRAFWSKVFIVAIAVPLSVAKNGLRIFIIAVLGTRVDPAYLTGRLHHQGGILFFAVALACIFAAIWICKRREGASEILTWAHASLPEAETNR